MINSELVALIRQDWLDSLKIGDTVFVFDGNKRSYDKDKKIVFRYHFGEAKIAGETRNSWIVKHWGEYKVNKKTGKFSPGGMVAVRGMIYSANEVEEECWYDENRMKIIDKLRNSSDVGLFKVVKDTIDNYGTIEKDGD